MRKEEWEKLVGRKLTEEEHRKLYEVWKHDCSKEGAADIAFLFKNRRDWFEIVHREAEKMRDVAVLLIKLGLIVGQLDILKRARRNKEIIQRIEYSKIEKALEQAEKLKETMRDIYDTILEIEMDMRSKEKTEDIYQEEDE